MIYRQQGIYANNYEKQAMHKNYGTDQYISGLTSYVSIFLFM